MRAKVLDKICQDAFKYRSNGEPIEKGLDENKAILKLRILAYGKCKGPRVGDILLLENGERRRFTYDWGDTIQTTWKNDGGCGFYLCVGNVSYSGSLDAPIEKSRLKRLPGHQLARFWFFHRDSVRAHNAIYFDVPVRVYKLMPAINNAN